MNYASIKDRTSLVLVSRLILLNQFNVLVIITFKNAQLVLQGEKGDAGDKGRVGYTGQTVRLNFLLSP